MANLEAMRTFQQHWMSYCAEERRLARLCTQLPVDISGLSDRERSLPLSAHPASVSYDYHALARALGSDGAHLGYRVDEGIQWNWWLGYEPWGIITRERALLEELAAYSAELAAVSADVQRALDTDEELVMARSTLRGYTTADAEEHSELDSLHAQRSAIVEPYEQDNARRTPWIAHPWRRLRLWLFKRFRMRDELDKLDKKAADIRALLGQWMVEYAARLPEEIVHARNVVESELVWLEGYAPYGKRYWPLTDRVVAAMEEGRADSSDLALKLVQGSS